MSSNTEAAKSIFLSVIIPAFNEEKRLPHTLSAVMSYLRKQPYSWEIVVVNDGSADKTAAVVKQVSEKEPGLKLLDYGQNQGKGYAVRQGMLGSQGKYRLFTDADNSTSIDQVEAFLPLLEQGFDIVIGSRDVKGAQIGIHQAWWKEALGDLGNVWIQLWAVPGIRDTQAGFKLFTNHAVETIFPYITLHRWGFDVEALAIARVRGFKIAERPIRWINDPDSKVEARAYAQVLWEVVQVRLNIWRGRYALQAKPEWGII